MEGNSYLQSIEQARSFVQAHYKDWEAIDEKILAISKNAQNIVVSDVDGSIKELNARIQQNVEFRKQMNAQVQEQQKLIKALRAEVSKLGATESSTSGKRLKDMTTEERVAYKQAQAQQRVNEVRNEGWAGVERSRKAAREEAKAVRALDSSYGQYSQQLLMMSKEYKDLAIQKMRLNNLNADEIKRMDALGAQITKLRGQLVQVDHRVGQFGRSVGSYGKQFDSLGFSMAQVTREFPAFAYGAQIGFAALSNNIPILADEINKLIATNKELAAQGKSTKSVFKTLAASIFGFQTLLSIGVTLLTLYGEEMVDAARKIVDFRTEEEKAKEALEEMNKGLEEFIDNMSDMAKVQLEGSKSAQEEALKLKLLNREVQNVNKSEAERNEIVNELREMYPEYLKGMSDEEIKTKGLGDAYGILSTKILEAARSRAAFDKILENQGKMLDIDAKLAAKKVELLEAEKASNITVEEYDKLLESTNARHNDAVAVYENQVDKIKTLRGEIQYLTGQQQKLELSNIDLMDSVTDLGKVVSNTSKSNAEAKRDEVKSIISLDEARAHSETFYESIISKLSQERSLVATNSEKWASYTRQIEFFTDALLALTDPQEYLRRQLQMTTEEAKAFKDEFNEVVNAHAIDGGLKELASITGESLDSLTEEFHTYYENDFDAFIMYSEAKLRAKEIETEKMKEYMSDIADAGVDFGNALFEAEIEKIDQRIDKNKDYYANLLDNEELTLERRAALEAERDNKERKLLKEKRKRENQQFLFNQGVALAEVAFSVAQGIAEATAMAPATFGASLSWIPLIVGAGALQAATIVAQSIPKFATGTEHAPEGMAIVDEINPEVHTDRYGRVKSFGSEGGSNLRFLEKGDKIYRSREEYFNKFGAGENPIEDTIWKLNMQYQGRPIPERDVNSALLGELAGLRSDTAKAWKEIKKLSSRPINVHNKIEMPDNRHY